MQITLANLKDATAQQVFDQVVTHLLTQNKKSQNENFQCQYRNPDGLACAAGCLISDEEMIKVRATNSNGSGWGGLITRINATTIHRGLILGLQTIHDNERPNDWEEKLIIMARNRDLNFNWVKPAESVPA